MTRNRRGAVRLHINRRGNVWGEMTRMECYDYLKTWIRQRRSVSTPEILDSDPKARGPMDLLVRVNPEPRR